MATQDSTTNQIEIWKDVVGYEGFYSVSNFGKVRSEMPKKGSTFKGKILRPARQGNGLRYLKLVLCKDKKHIGFTVHRLVAEAFIGKRPVGYEINHKDGCSTNNKFQNLEYVTHQENISHAKNILKSFANHPKGEKHWNAKITDRDAKEIRNLYYKKVRTQKELSKIYKISSGNIKNIIKRRAWRHI